MSGFAVDQQEFDHHLHFMLQRIILENDAFAETRKSARHTLEEMQNDRVSESFSAQDSEIDELVRATCTRPDGQVAENLSIVTAAPWEPDAWATFEPAESQDPVPLMTRVGILKGGQAPAKYAIPALVPFLGAANLVIMAKGPAIRTARAALNALLFRSVISVRPGRCRLYLVDTREAGRVFSQTRRLVPTLCRQPSNLWDPQEIHRLLGDLVSHIEQVNRDHLAGQYVDIRDYNANGGGDPLSYRVVALTDFPEGINQDGARLLRMIGTNGPSAGIQLAMVVDTALGDSEKLIDAIRDTSTIVRLGEDGQFRVDHPQLAPASLTFDALPKEIPSWILQLANHYDVVGPQNGSQR